MWVPPSIKTWIRGHGRPPEVQRHFLNVRPLGPMSPKYVQVEKGTVGPSQSHFLVPPFGVCSPLPCVLPLAHADV